MSNKLIIIFYITLVVSAFLLFCVQFMVAKMILPLLGGSSSVWNTSQVFFQATLLLSYGYVHLTTRWGNLRYQSVMHSVLVLLPLAFLPVTIRGININQNNPIISLLIMLILSVGLPFFVVATSAPLIQKWFADIKGSDHADPYFLYTASNLGSMLGVICYPTLIEPNFSLSNQRFLWAIGYEILVLLIWLCALYLWISKLEVKNFQKTSSISPTGLRLLHYQWWMVGNSNEFPTLQIAPLSKSYPSLRQKTKWILLAFLPSSLFLGVTTYLTTDLASFPLLWAIPLAIYLLTFILTFAQKPLLPYGNLITILPLLLTPLIILSLLKVMQPLWLLLPLHLLGLFITAAVFHGELAQSRPHSDYLTGFYLWLSFGGVLGGLFNAIAAPLLFQSVLEYPLIMGLSLVILQLPDITTKKGLNQAEREAAFLQQVLDKYPSQTPWEKREELTGLERIKRLILPISMGVLIGSLLVGLQLKFLTSNLIGILFALIILITLRYAFKLHLLRFGVGITLILLLNLFFIPSMGSILETKRSFFGVNRVLYDQKGNYHTLLHGTTVHGKQSLDPKRRYEPLTYFYHNSPIGQLFEYFHNNKHIENVAVMGLGVGTLAAYSERGQHWTFYEIDPVVENLASNNHYFTFLEAAKAKVSIVLGDARLQLNKVVNNHYDLIVMDAFSSDAIPVHLVTKEAIELYLSKLKKDGLIIINISNRYINLEPVLDALAQNLGLSSLRQLDLNISATDKARGKTASHWVILARQRQDFGNLINDIRWQTIEQNSNIPLWTDDFSNIFNVLRWNGLTRLTH